MASLLELKTRIRLETNKDDIAAGGEAVEALNLAIARAIVADPKVLVADEPTGDLDAKSAEEILALMETLNREFKKTIVMVTHDPRAAQRAHTQHHLEKGVLAN